MVEDVPHHHRAFYFLSRLTLAERPRHDGEVRFSDGGWQLEPAILDRPVLSFALPETAYAVLLSWDPGWRFEGLLRERPVAAAQRDGAFEYTDWFLDVRIPPERDRYEWKDEHELLEAVERGILAEDHAHEVRWAGERAVEQVLLREPPFDLDWPGVAARPGVGSARPARGAGLRASESAGQSRGDPPTLAEPAA